MIENLFVGVGIDFEVAALLSRFLTIGGTLPLGLPTSPIVSNAIFLKADEDLKLLADKYGLTYTRYSDDLSFSSNKSFSCTEDISKIVKLHGFNLAMDKTKNSKLGQAHYVTGLSITDPDGPHVPRDKKRRLRQELYYAKKFGLKEHFRYLQIIDPKTQQHNVNRIDGLVKFVSYHEPRHAGRLKPKWTEILASAGARPSYEPLRQNRNPFCISIDEAEFSNVDETILAIGMSVSQHQSELFSAASEVLGRWTSDPWAAGNRDAIEKRGLHFVDASEDLRFQFIDRMRTLPFEGYISFGRLMSPKLYEEFYLQLLGSVIKRRLMAAESQSLLILIEENGKVTQEKVEKLINNNFSELKASNNRRPKSISIQFRSKPSLDISYPDFLLGILGKYLRSKNQKPGTPIPRDRLLFEKLRDKYRLILDFDTGVEFSRRRPIMPWALNDQL